MAEKKYIDSKKFNSKLNYIIRAYGLSGVISEKIKKAINDSLAADAKEVVRCKDCINRKTEDCAMYYRCNCGEQHTWENDNNFCSYGERKDEGA